MSSAISVKGFDFLLIDISGQIYEKNIEYRLLRMKKVRIMVANIGKGLIFAVKS